MPREIHGKHVVDGQRFAIVVSRFNEFITSKLVSGAVDVLHRHGCADENITCVFVPGAYDIAPIAMKLAGQKKYDAVICLGCVIRGQTPHFEYVASEVSKGVAQVGLQSGVPTTFGVITADTIEQAVDRAGIKAGNKGSDAAISAIELVDVMRQLDGDG